MNKRGIFLDRDGTIIEEKNYLSQVEEVNLLPSSAQAIKLLNENGFKVIVISNQSGIGRGYFTKETVDEIHQKMKTLLAKEDAFIDKVYYCPHKPSDNCNCRKPKVGMLNLAAKDLQIALKESYLVGDKVSDLKTGVNAGLRTILVLTGYGKESSYELKAQSSSLKPDYTAKDLLSAVKWILKVSEK